MPTMLLRFPGGRYHATPHGHHVNEGLVEWPPSPWRLLRALIATGYATQSWTELPAAARRLILALAETLPVFRLPRATLGHSRHFMPLGSFDKGREATTLVFDAWADVGDGTLMVRWNCALDDEAHEMFERLVTHLGYLGRSESWAIGTTIDDYAPLTEGGEAFPHVDGQQPGSGWELTSLLAAQRPGVYAHWRDGMVAEALRELPASDGKRKPSVALLKKRAAAVAPFPSDALESLQCDTAWWKKYRWSQAPGSRQVLYCRRADALRSSSVERVAVSSSRRAEAMLLALTTRSGNRSALPSVVRTLPQAELIHRALIGGAAKGGRIECPELTGRDDEGKLLKGHQHAHILPLDLDRDGHLDHVLIYARMGLGNDAQQAVRTMKRTWMKDGGELQIALAGQGALRDLQNIPDPLGAGIKAVLGGQGGACTWMSTTPLVLPRHAKRRGSNTREGQIRAELTSRRFPPVQIEILPWSDRTLKLRHVVRVRRRPAMPPPADAGHAIRLHFQEPVVGPIALGYASHFGLGLFVSDP